MGHLSDGQIEAALATGRAVKAGYEDQPSQEGRAIDGVDRALSNRSLTPEARHRVLQWAWSKYIGGPKPHTGEGWLETTTTEDWTIRQAGLCQAIPPAYTQFIGEQLLTHLGIKA